MKRPAPARVQRTLSPVMNVLVNRFLSEIICYNDY